ncbi:unnamed protein product, partial [Protopolystoma xenopodis]
MFFSIRLFQPASVPRFGQPQLAPAPLKMYETNMLATLSFLYNSLPSSWLFSQTNAPSTPPLPPALDSLGPDRYGPPDSWSWEAIKPPNPASWSCPDPSQATLCTNLFDENKLAISSPEAMPL